MGNAIKYKRIFAGPGGDISLDPRITILENNEYKVTYFESVSSASGTITKPTNSTILLDQFAGGVDAYVSTIVNGQPTGILPRTAGGVDVDVTSFDTLGAYTLSGTPSAYPVAIIYILKIKAIDYPNLTISNILELEETAIEKASTTDLNTGTNDTRFATSLGLESSKYLNQNGTKLSATASGTDTYTASLTPAITSYVNTQRFFIKFTNANTGAATLNLNGVGAIAIKKDVSSALIANDIKAGQIVPLAYDGTNFQIIGGGGLPVGTTAGTVAAGDDSRFTNSRFWITVPGTPVRVGNTSFTITDTANANLYDLLLGRTTVLKWTDTTTKMAMIVSATYAANAVTVTIIGDTLTATATMSTFKYGTEKAKPIVFASAGTVAVLTNIAGTWPSDCAMKVFGADGYHDTAGTTNATTYDINKNGTTMFTTKLSIASAATSGLGFTANDGTELTTSDLITLDCDTVSTTAPITITVKLFVIPLRLQYLN